MIYKCNYNIKIVKKRIIVIKRLDNIRFSKIVFNKIEWDFINYLIYIIFYLKKNNIKNINNLFYEKALNNIKILNIF